MTQSGTSHARVLQTATPLRVFITGASSGLGWALTQHYAQQGAMLGVFARREAPLLELQTKFPQQIYIYQGDVTEPHTLQNAAQDFLEKAGTPDIVIANAGISVGTLTQCEEDFAVFQRIMNVNLMGMVATFQPFIEAMRQQKSGRLVGIASVAGVRGIPGAGAYSASKAAVISYLESLRVELATSGVRVVTIAPGYIATPMTDVNPYSMPFILQADEAARRMVRHIQAGRSYVVVPWQMGWVAKLLRILPNWLFDCFAARAGRKPRGLKF